MKSKRTLSTPFHLQTLSSTGRSGLKWSKLGHEKPRGIPGMRYSKLHPCVYHLMT